MAIGPRAFHPTELVQVTVTMEPGESANHPSPIALEEDSEPSLYDSEEQLYSDSDEEIIGYDDAATLAAAGRASRPAPAATPAAPAKSRPSAAAKMAEIRQGLGFSTAGGVGAARPTASRVATVDDAAIVGTDDEMCDAFGNPKSKRLPASHARREYKGAPGLRNWPGDGSDRAVGLAMYVVHLLGSPRRLEEVYRKW